MLKHGGGILLSPLAILAGAILWSFQQILNASVWIVEAIGGGSANYEDVFISNIVFSNSSNTSTTNRDEVRGLKLVNANIFDANNVGSGATANPILKGSATGSSGIMQTIYKWYGTTRIIALAGTLVTLVYVAIKIIAASTGADKAKYMTLLKDWILSLLLIFVIHYVMATILFASDAIVGFFATEAGRKIFVF